MWFSQNVHPHGTLQKQGKLVDLRANSTEFLEKKKKDESRQISYHLDFPLIHHCIFSAVQVLLPTALYALAITASPSPDFLGSTYDTSPSTSCLSH